MLFAFSTWTRAESGDQTCLPKPVSRFRHEDVEAGFERRRCLFRVREAVSDVGAGGWTVLPPLPRSGEWAKQWHTRPAPSVLCQIAYTHISSRVVEKVSAGCVLPTTFTNILLPNITKMWNYRAFFIALFLSAVSVTDILAYVEVFYLFLITCVFVNNEIWFPVRHSLSLLSLMETHKFPSPS